jgi:hypothetical protein
MQRNGKNCTAMKVYCDDFWLNVSTERIKYSRQQISHVKYKKNRLITWAV